MRIVGVSARAQLQRLARGYRGGGGHERRARDGHRPDYRRRKEPTRRQAAPPGELLCGLHVVTLALEAQTRELHELMLERERVREGEFRDLQARAVDAGVSVSLVSKERLNNVLSAGGNGHRAPRHQGVVLRAGGLEFDEISSSPASVDELLVAMSDSDTDAVSSIRRRRRVVLALDEVVDPQNMGALLRTALFVGVTAVVASKRNCAPLTPAVSTSSAGALEVLAAEGRLACVRQLPLWLNSLRKIERADGTPPWRVLGADMGGAEAAGGGGEGVKSGGGGGDGDSDVVLVMGSEGSGLRTTVRAACDALIAAPRAAPPTGSRHPSAALVDSLNVSVSAGILLDRLTAAH